MDNRTQLKKLMDEHGLTRAETANLLGVSITTVHSWLAPETNKKHRKLSDRMMELLIFKIIALNNQWKNASLNQTIL